VSSSPLIEFIVDLLLLGGDTTGCIVAGGFFRSAYE